MSTQSSPRAFVVDTMRRDGRRVAPRQLADLAAAAEWITSDDFALGPGPLDHHPVPGAAARCRAAITHPDRDNTNGDGA